MVVNVLWNLDFSVDKSNGFGIFSKSFIIFYKSFVIFVNK